MRIINKLRTFGLVTVMAGVIVGCAGTTEQDTAAAAAADAIAAAKSANAQAAAENYEWRDTGKMISDAEKAMKDGDHAKAISLANAAQRQAEYALAQKSAELDRLRKEGILNGATAAAPAAPAAAGAGQYQVNRGDNLWNISGNASVYGNPYQWPLIYKANQDQIKDADLIYPGQVFNIDQNASAADVNAAIQHAKTRGSWSLGQAEESDKAYLGR
ncbi:MAG: LysM peptidoglycan-binding domain-containing protein [Gammaproteobacteria bacterium]